MNPVRKSAQLSEAVGYGLKANAENLFHNGQERAQYSISQTAKTRKALYYLPPGNQLRQWLCSGLAAQPRKTFLATETMTRDQLNFSWPCVPAGTMRTSASE